MQAMGVISTKGASYLLAPSGYYSDDTGVFKHDGLELRPVSGIVNKLKLNSHEWHKLLLAVNRRALYHNATLANHDIEGYIPDYDSVFMDCLEVSYTLKTIEV